MTPISQDPARRIRRIQRWLSEYAGAPEFDVMLIGDDDSLHDKRVFELMRLAGLEIDWLCKYALDARKHMQREDNNKAVISLELVATEQTISEQKARIEKLEKKLKQCADEYADFLNPLRPGDF